MWPWVNSYIKEKAFYSNFHLSLLHFFNLIKWLSQPVVVSMSLTALAAE